jgi:hypothetical protein
MTPRERKDVPWLAVIAVIVAVAVLAGIIVSWR